MEILVRPANCEYGDRLAGLAGQAAGRLGLAGRIERLVFRLDDIAAHDRAWIGAEPAGGGVCVWCHPEHFCKDRWGGAAPLPSDFPWELTDSFDRRDEAEPDEPLVFSTAKAERFVYHHLQLILDLRDGIVDPSAIPEGMTAAFEEAWAVTIDGRLRRRSLPGMTVAERRRRFYRAFSAGGLVLPQHWLIFRSLWEEDGWTQQRLLDALSDLPPAGTPRGGGR